MISGDPSCVVAMGKISENNRYNRIFVLGGGGGVPIEGLIEVFILFRMRVM
jgi:hypothetical protein